MKRYFMTLAVLVTAGTVRGASLNANLPEIMGTAAFELPVFDGKAAYRGGAAEGFGDGMGVFGDGTVLAYRLVNAPDSGSIDGDGYASSGSRVGLVTASRGNEYDVDSPDVWTTVDPGELTNGIPVFSSTADFGGTDLTLVGCGAASGTVDISGLATGIVYILCGSHDRSGFSVTATMKDEENVELDLALVAQIVTCW